jgi:hypothetical protein
MRQVTTPNFCSVCKEGLWLSLLKNVTLIDSLDEYCLKGSTTKTLNMTLVPLAQFRDTPVEGLEESIQIKWTKDGQVLGDWANKTVVQIDGDSAKGQWVVEVQYTTEEIRVDNDGLTKDRIPFNVTEACSA